ncbi:hypothetical protein M885DRAFT_621611 [Pelagophyceae sp. CCMP2097]|nr:hypothetical protein M885DRAFT_621611 [Pelagophyceae sp. CCMP2097]
MSAAAAPGGFAEVARRRPRGQGAGGPAGRVGGKAGKAGKVMVSIPCVSLSMPFAALVLNGSKTIETRDSSHCFSPLQGKVVAIRIGHNDWDDGDFWKTCVSDESAGAVPDESKFRKGAIAGVVKVGETQRIDAYVESGDWTSVVQKTCLARDALPRKFGTEISDAQWLSRGVPAPGKPGAYEVQIAADALPKSVLAAISAQDPFVDEDTVAVLAPAPAPRVVAPVVEVATCAAGPNRKARRAAALEAAAQVV